MLYVIIKFIIIKYVQMFIHIYSSLLITNHKLCTCMNDMIALLKCEKVSNLDTYSTSVLHMTKLPRIPRLY